jgi:hypothetical protein
VTDKVNFKSAENLNSEFTWQLTKPGPITGNADHLLTITVVGVYHMETMSAPSGTTSKTKSKSTRNSTKEREKFKDRDKDKEGDTTKDEKLDRLKTVVRRLPPNLPEEVFWQSVQTWVTDEIVSWKVFYPGKVGGR